MALLSISVELTMPLAQDAKKRKVRLAALTQQAWTISHMVWALAAMSLRKIMRTPKRRTWMVTPEACQKDPLTSYCQEMLEFCRRVVVQVHWETMMKVVRSVLTIGVVVLQESGAVTQKCVRGQRHPG